MYASQANKPASALASGAIVAGMLAMLVFSLDAEQVVETAQSLVAVNIAPPKPSPTPTPTPPPKSEKAAPKGDPGQRNLKNKATQIVAVKPPILIVKPPPVVVATTPANTGNATQSGMSDRPGPGQGAGDYGSGLGGGGTGGDGGGAAVVGPRKIRGELAFRDLPEDLLAPGDEAGVEVRYTVRADGRVSGCRVVTSSGNRTIDALTCRNIERRYVFRPARNRLGRPVDAMVQHWSTYVAYEQ